MTDVLTPAQRRRNMRAIKSKDTKPEMIVRRLVHGMGYRFRLHRKDLPGKPDLVLPRHGKVIFVHGCFWHMHRCKYGRVTPRTNAAFWRTKRKSNVLRDRKNRTQLRKMGWDILTVWECQTRDITKLQERILRFILSSGTRKA